MGSPLDQFLTFVEARLRRMAAEEEDFRRHAARMAAHLAGASPAAEHDINELRRQLTTKEG